jgi:Ca2+-binding RTX toxin-like protein
LSDPLVLDLDGDGVELIHVADSEAYFDYAGTGFAFHTGWVAADDGILIREIDQNPNTVTAAELLGAMSGNAFQDLTGLDGNQDSVINASDSVFSELQIWRDLDGDAVADTGELMSLATAGIAAINLGPQASGQSIAGNTVVETSTFVRTDSATGTVAEVNFATDTMYSRFTPPANFEFSSSALLLPSLVGYGLVPDLIYSMSLRPDLEDAVQDLVLEANEMSGSEFATAFETLVQNWAGVDDVNPTSAGPLIDARHLALVEAFYGATFAEMNGTNATLNAVTAAGIEATYHSIIDELQIRFATQISHSQALNGVSDTEVTSSPFFAFATIDFNSMTDGLGVDFDALVESVIEAAPTDPAEQFAYYDLTVRLLRSLRVDLFDENSAALATAFLAAASLTNLTPGLQAFIVAEIEAATLVYGSDGNETLQGATGDDVVSSGAGNDTLTGNGGDDLYVFNTGDGQDTVREWSGFGSAGAGGYDTIQLGPGIDAADVTVNQVNGGQDLRIAINGTSDQVTILGGVTWGSDYRIEQVRFDDGSTLSYAQLMALATTPTSGNDSFMGDDLANTLSGDAGNDTLQGRHGSDTLGGGAGSDTLMGDGGDDTYLFSLGDGQDTVREWSGVGSAGAGGYDTIQFGAGITAADIVVTSANSGRDLAISVSGTSDQVIIMGAIAWGTDYRVERVRFADGTTLTHEDLITEATAATPGNDTLTGDSSANVIFGGAGNDTLQGRQGNDVLEGGTGNDTLMGDAGDDTYIFNVGDGQDFFREWSGFGSAGSGGNDTIQFGTGISASNLTVSQANGGQDLVLSISGTTDQITLFRGVTGFGDYRFEQVRFEDGSTLTHAQLMALATTPTAGNDSFVGDELANPLSGGAGNDTLQGRQGNDTLTGGIGNDTAIGDAGDDTYVFGLGDGQDTVREWSGIGSAGAGGNDTIQLGPGIAAGDLTVSQANGGQDLRIAINGTSDQITILGGVTWGTDYRIDQVRFDDGSTLTHAQLMTLATTATPGNDTFLGDELANTLSGAAGNDTLQGRHGNDTLAGGSGSDMLMGDAGNDTYLFNLGDGQDTVREWSGFGSAGAGGTDTIQFGAGIELSDLVVTQANAGQDLVISIDGTTDQVTIYRGITGGGDYRIEQVRLDDGTTLSHAQLMALSTTPTAGNDLFFGDEAANTISGADGNDTLNARSGNDILEGGAGNDTLTGGAGNDVFIFKAAAGQDIVTDFAAGSGVGDVIEFHDGIFADFAAVLAAATASGNNTIITIDANTKITLQNVALSSLHQNDFLFV